MFNLGFIKGGFLCVMVVDSLWVILGRNHEYVIALVEFHTNKELN